MKTQTINPNTMKNILLLMLLFTGIVNAQIVNIPDANFKAALIANGVDTNSDGNIQESEALSTTIITVGQSNITDLTGIQSFTNMTYLECSDNQLVTLDVSGLLNLETIACWNNQLTSLNINGCSNIITLDCYNNQIGGNLDLSNNLLLNYLECSNNNFLSIDVSNCTNLNILICNNNPNLLSLNASNCSSLFDQIYIENLGNPHYLNLSNCTSITSFYADLSGIGQSNLETLDISGCNSLNVVSIINNPFLTLITANNLINVTTLQIAQNSILTNVFLSNCPNLSVLYIYENNLNVTFNNSPNTINFSNFLSLSYLALYNSNLTTLNLSNNINLTQIDLLDNLVLERLFIKNGLNETLNLSNSPNINFICADESQVVTIQTQLINQGLTSTVCNSYCTFIPGGNYNTISGTVFLDADSNGCEANENFNNLVKIKISDGTNDYYTFTNQQGHYSFNVLAGNYIVSTKLENPAIYTLAQNNYSVNFPDNNNNSSINDFCLNIIYFPDVEIVISPEIPARPGFDSRYKIVYKNKGNQLLSGNVNLTYDDAVLDFVSATQTPDSQSTGLLTWNYTNLLPFENRSFYITFNVNSPTETPPVNIGDLLNFLALINPIVNDEMPSDNNFAYKQTVVGSFDPNNVTCLEGETVSPSQIGNYLHYVVNFENTGTFQAENVVVKDVIDTTKYDINSLQVMNTSDEAYIKITGNVVEFIFENINLVAASGNPPVGGHGNVLFKIKSKDNLVTGDFVSKTAKIYFDYNAPIDTNIAQTTFQTLNNSVFELDNSISVYPNPTNSIINIKSDFNIKSVELYDIMGRILESHLGTVQNIDISDKSNGIYFVKVSTDKGSKVEKIVKE